jgi:outer membrane protein insertion porin family
MKKILFLTPLMLFATNNQINKVEFNGLKHISKISAKQISLLHKGDFIDMDKINKTIKDFYSYGYFENIKASFDNGILNFEFQEKPEILTIKYKHVTEDLKKLLKDKIKRGEIFSNKKLEEIRNFITSYYDAKGKFNSVVIFNTQKKGNAIILKIIINEGYKITIDDLKFNGVKKESINNIKNNIKNVNRDILGWLPFRNNGELSLQGLLEDPNSIREFYLSKGYLDVKVSHPLLLANFDNNKASLEYKIDEGNRYKVSYINIDVDKSIIDVKKYKDKLLLLKGHYFNVKRLQKDMDMLKRAIADKGYAYVVVYPDIKKDGDKVKVTYKIIPGKKVYISDVIISGNTKTLDSVIRRNVYLFPNYLYSITDKEDTIAALKRTGYFESVELKQKKVDDTHIKIFIKVKEGLTGSLKAGISYNSYSKFGVNLGVNERNVFGSGQSLSLSVDKTAKSTTYNINLLNPAVNDSKYSLDTNIYDTKYSGYSYTSRKKGISFTTGRKLTRNSRGYITYGYEKLHLTDIQDNVIDDYREYSTKQYVIPGITYNSTDDRFFPQHGINAGASVTYAGFGGTQKFLKTNLFGKYFYSLDDKFAIMTILKYKFKFGYLNEIGYTPISEKYYLGGLGSVRGYNWGSISPKDNSGNSIGGNRMFTNTLEISVPFNLKRKMWLSAFVDNGYIGKNSFDITRSSYGVSFDWITPIGPLDFTYALPIGAKDGDDLRKFEFSIGTSF